MPSTPGRTNRIEVDLKLLQDANLAKLQEFGSQFDKSITSLGQMLGTYADQIAAAMGMAGPGQTGAGKPGPDDSMAANVNITGPQARRGGQPYQFPFNQKQFLNNDQQGYYPPVEDSVAPTQLPTSSSPGMGQGLSGIEEQYVRAQKYIGGGIPVGIRQTLGYIAEGQFMGQVPDLDENDQIQRNAEGQVMYTKAGVGPFSISQKTAQKVASGLFTGQAVVSNVGLMGQHLSNIRSGIMGAVQTGMNLGQARTDSNSGWGTLEGLAGGLGGPAWRSAMGMQWQSLKDSMFGLNPSYSPEQAQNVKNTIQSYGYGSGSTYNFLSNQLKDLQIKSNISPDVAMQVLDPFVRYGGTENFQQLQEVLSSLPGAAKAAQMNLKDFAEAVMQTATQVATSTGMTVGGAANAITAFSSVTGLNPSQASTLMSDPNNYLLAAGMSGQNIWQLTAGNNKMAPLMEFGLNQFKNSVGGLDPKQIMAGLNSKNPAVRNQMQQVMSRAQLLYIKNPQIFGGQAPREILNQAMRAGGTYQGILNRVQVQEKLGDLDPTKQNYNWNQMISEYGGSRAFQDKTEEGLQKVLSTHTGNTAKDTMARNKAAQKYLLDRFDKADKAAGQKAAKEMTIGMTGETKKYFNLLNKAFGTGNKPAANQGTSAKDYAREAMRVGGRTLSGAYVAEGATSLAKDLGIPGAGAANSAAKDLAHFWNDI